MKRYIPVLFVMLVSFLITGCQPFFMDMESIIATEVAFAVETKIAEMDSLEDVSVVGSPNVSLPTSYPTSAPEATPKPKTYFYNYSNVIGTPGGCLNAIFISENYRDNTKFEPGDGFIKEWTIENTGYCTWNTNYHLVLESGYAMGGDTYMKLPEKVSPGERITLQANLTAPSSPGTYRGEWRVQSDLGVNFARFWVQIVVD